MNQLLVDLDLASWKPLLGALVLPPVPLLLVVLVGARLLPARRAWGWALVGAGVLGLWFSTTTVAADGLERALLKVPAALAPERIEALRRTPGSAIVVLGAGVEPLAPEYGASSLSATSLQRLRYGLWLGRETGLPVAFAGGTGWGGLPGATEAEAAVRVAAEDFQRPLRWTEGESRDTRENAARIVPVLQRAGIRHILLVTHGWHMPRARRHFEQAGAPAGIRIEPAPMGLARRTHRRVLDWLPSTAGFTRVRQVLHEALGRAMGA